MIIFKNKPKAREEIINESMVLSRGRLLLEKLLQNNKILFYNTNTKSHKIALSLVYSKDTPVRFTSTTVKMRQQMIEKLLLRCSYTAKV